MKLQNGKLVGVGVDPEVYRRQTAERGHADYVMSRSDMVEFLRCPWRWRHGYRDGDDDDTKSTGWGNLVDCLLLDDARFASKFVMTPATYLAAGRKKSDPPVEKPWNMNAAVCKEWCEENANGKTIVKADTLDDAKLAVRGMLDDEIAQTVMQRAERQVMLVAEFTDGETIVPVKGLVDIVPAKDGAWPKALCDFKTCRSASPDGWPNEIWKYGYHVQAALYLDLWWAASGERRHEFIHLTQENVAPFAICPHIMDTEFISLGRSHYDDALHLYAKCLREQKWPKYVERAQRVLRGMAVASPRPWMQMAQPSIAQNLTADESISRAGI